MHGFQVRKDLVFQLDVTKAYFPTSHIPKAWFPMSHILEASIYNVPIASPAKVDESALSEAASYSLLDFRCLIRFVSSTSHITKAQFPYHTSFQVLFTRSQQNT